MTGVQTCALPIWFLKDPTGEARTHQAVRKNYSLPLIPSMGGAVRIRRRDNNGTAIWQTLSPEGLLNCGFAVVDGRIDFGQETPLPIIAQSPNAHVHGMSKPTESMVCPFDLMLELEIPELLREIIHRLWMKPNSKTRPLLRFEMQEGLFRSEILQKTGGDGQSLTSEKIGRASCRERV